MDPIPKPPESTDRRPYTISPLARARLEKWTGGGDALEKILSIGQKFSYSHPEIRAERLFNGLVVDVPFSDSDHKLLYMQYSCTHPDDPYGECSELARRAIIKGVVEGVFSGQDRKNTLQPLLVGGYAPTHYIEGNAIHYWVGIIPSGEQETSTRDMVVFDPSFRVISTLNESGYAIVPGHSDISTAIPELETGWNYVDYGKICFTRDRFSPVTTKDTEAILGISNDYQFGVALSVCKNVLEAGQYHALVTLHNGAGDDAYYAVHAPKTSRVMLRACNGYSESDLSDATYAQVSKILDITNARVKQLTQL